MRKKAAITTGVAAAVLGGGLALALNGGGAASAAGTTAAVAPARPAGSPAVPKISRSEAEQIALAAVPGGRVTSAELESEHGVPVWSVRVTDGGVRHDLDINAYTGKVIRDRDDDARPAGPAAPGPRHDRARAAEHRHGEAEPGDDHGRHGEAEGHHGGDDGHRGRGH
jgi:hypothetical protein